MSLIITQWKWQTDSGLDTKTECLKNYGWKFVTLYRTAPWDDQLSSKLINHHFMPHQALCWSSQQGPLEEPMGSWLFCLAGWDFHKQGRFWQANKYVVRLCHGQQPAPPAKWWGSAWPGRQWVMAEPCLGRWQSEAQGGGAPRSSCELCGRRANPTLAPPCPQGSR